MTATFDADTRFVEIRSDVTSRSDDILPVLQDIADKAALAVIGLSPSQYLGLTDQQIADEAGSEVLTDIDPASVQAPEYSEIMTNANAMIDWLEAQASLELEFPPYEQVVTESPTEPDLLPLPADPYTLSDVPDPEYTTPVWDEASAWQGDDALAYAGPLSASFEYVDDDYVSPLYANSANQLHEILISELSANSFGIGPDNETDIHNRAVEREEKVMLSAVEGALALFSAGGFDAPTGVAAAMAARLRAESRDRIASASRELLIKKYDAHLEAKKLAVQTAAQVEQAYQAFFNTMRDRYLKRMAQEITSTVEVAAHNLQRVNIFVDRYKAFAQVFASQVEASKGAVDVFRSRVQAEETKAKANQAVAEAVIAKNKGIVDTFLAQVEAYKTTIDGRVKYHSAAADVVKAKAEEFAAKVSGMRSAYELADKKESNLISFRVGKYNADIANTKLKLDELLGFLNIKLEQFKQQVQAAATLATGAMSALNVNLGLNLSGSTSLSGSDSYSTDESADTIRKSQSTSISSSNSSSINTNVASGTSHSVSTNIASGTSHNETTYVSSNTNVNSSTISNIQSTS